MKGAVLAVFLVGCASSSSPAAERFVASDDGFSLAAPPTWAPRADRGAIVFTSAEQPRRTLAIRSMLASDPEVQARAVKATKIVIEGLPGARVTATRPIDGPMQGVSYELTFVPPGSRDRYARTHVVLVGDQRVFHVIETVPAREAKRDGVVNAVLASFRKEV